MKFLLAVLKIKEFVIL